MVLESKIDVFEEPITKVGIELFTIELSRLLIIVRVILNLGGITIPLQLAHSKLNIFG